MRSLAAWGSIPLDKHRHMYLNCGIGIDYEENTKIVRVVLVFYANTEKYPFTKKGTHVRLISRLAVDHPSVLLWKGTWEGDPDKVKTELFAALTGFFKKTVICLIAEDSYQNSNGNFARNKEDIPVIRSAVLGWLLENEKSKGDFSYTNLKCSTDFQILMNPDNKNIDIQHRETYRFILKQVSEYE
jgi:hypothetical protein